MDAPNFSRQTREFSPARPNDAQFLPRMLAFAQQCGCDRACLVVHPGLVDITSRTTALERLRPWLREQVKTSTWPGVQMHPRVPDPDLPTVHRYHLTPEFAPKFCSLGGALQDWISPHLPEDLHVLRPDDSVLFASVATEQDCWFSLRPDEQDVLQRHFPDLATPAPAG